MRLQDKIVFCVLFVFLLFLGLNRHSRHPRYNYHSQIFTDKSGYHVYLPALFYYDMDACKMPNNIVEKTGRGFHFSGDRIITKYPLGVALLHSPFFGVAAIYDALSGEQKELGYTESHHVALNWSSAFYGTLGLLLLWLTVFRFWGLTREKAYLLCFLVLFCSNLLYYITRDAGMSHVYSFFVFACGLYLWFASLKAKELSSRKIWKFILVGSLIFALRPLNLVFLVFPTLFLLIENKFTLRQIKISRVTPSRLFFYLLALTPIYLQLAYNHYAFGSILSRGYAVETFSNWGNLSLLTFWFAPNNGVFLYIPILLLVIYWVFEKCKEKKYYSLFFLIYFLIISFAYAAWWSPTLGCGFGHRGFTEHLALFALPIGQVVKGLNQRWSKVLWGVSIATAIYLFIWQWNFDGCWYGDGAWDWNEFLRMMSF